MTSRPAITRLRQNGSPAPRPGEAAAASVAEPDVVTETWCGRFSVEVQTVTGRAAGVEFRSRMDTVEVWHHKRCAAVFDRELLRFWLAQPDAPLEVDEVVFSLDRAVDQDGRVAISLLDVVCWTFSPVTLKSLRKRV